VVVFEMSILSGANCTHIWAAAAVDAKKKKKEEEVEEEEEEEEEEWMLAGRLLLQSEGEEDISMARAVF
jgi:ribosomal protein L12E/L44/L45/RPP1/RPP2